MYLNAADNRKAHHRSIQSNETQVGLPTCWTEYNHPSARPPLAYVMPTDQSNHRDRKGITSMIIEDDGTTPEEDKHAYRFEEFSGLYTWHGHTASSCSHL